MMPDARGRTSAVRVAAMRPGRSLVIGTSSAFTVMTATCGGGKEKPPCAACSSLQPARIKRAPKVAIEIGLMKRIGSSIGDAGKGRRVLKTKRCGGRGPPHHNIQTGL